MVKKLMMACALAMASVAFAGNSSGINPQFIKWQKMKAAGMLPQQRKAAAQPAPAPEPTPAPKKKLMMKAMSVAAPLAAAPAEDVEPENATLPPVVFSLAYLSSANARSSQPPVGGFPARYDLRDEGRLTSAKAQGKWNTCWAFASYGALESAILSAGGGTYDFSEKHMVDNHGYDYSVSNGGSFLMAMAYLLRWNGPVAESVSPYPTGDNWTASSGSLTVPAQQVQNVRFIRGRVNSADNNEIKNAILAYGAVYSTLRWESSFYSAQNTSYNYDIDRNSCNHAVTIIGWDDDFPASRFSVAAAGNGAFIVKNSRGAAWGDDGCFYVSYYDTHIGYEAMYAFNDVATTPAYATIYQHDDLGLVDAHNGGETARNAGTAWGANVFTAEKDDTLAAVGFYALVPNTSVNIEIYRLSPNGVPTSPISDELLLRQNGVTLKDAGYVTVPLDDYVEISAGDRFSVVLKVTTPGYKTPLAIERPWADTRTTKATGRPGESFYSKSTGKVWCDFAEIGSRYTGSSFCCKAYGLGDEYLPMGEVASLVADGPLTIAAGKSGSFSLTQVYENGERWPSSDFRVEYDSPAISAVSYSGDPLRAVVSVKRDLAENTDVIIRLVDFDSGLEREYAFTATKAAPPPPTGLAATAGEIEDGVRISWSGVEGVETYKVYRASGANAVSGSATFIGDVAGLFYTDTTAVPGVDYTYFVKSFNNSGASAFASGVTGWRKLAPPADLAASDGDEDYVQLTWEAAEGANFYKVFRATDMDENGDPVGAVEVSEWIEQCSWRDTPPEKGTNYFYWVKSALSFTGLRESGWSIFDSGSRKAPVTLSEVRIEGPVSVAAGSTEEYTLTAILSTGDRVERVSNVTWRCSLSTGSVVSGTYGLEALVDGKKVSAATVVTLTAEYSFANEDGTTVRTDTKAVTITPVVPVRPKAVKVVSSSPEEGIALAWDEVEGAEFYRVYCGESAESATLVGEARTCSFTDHRALPSDNCRYYLVAANAAGASPKSEPSETVVRQLPTTSYVVASEGSNRLVTVAWLPVNGAKSYRVYRAAEPSAEPEAITDWIAGTGIVDEKVNPGDTYWYFVQAAIDATGLGASRLSKPTIGKARPEETLVAIEISGPSSIQYDSAGAFGCKAIYANGVRKEVRPNWGFKSSNPLVTVSASGVVSAGHVTGSDLHLELTASYTDDGVTCSDSVPVTVIAWKPVEAQVFVSNVVVRARWPWNGVIDISYDLYSVPDTTRAVVTVTGRDRDLDRSLEAVTLAGDGVEYPAAGGSPHKDCRVTWNLGADYTNFHASAFSVTLEAAPFAVQPPAGLSATDGASTNAVELGWEEAFGAEYYEIFRSTSNSREDAVRIANVTNATTWSDETAEPGETYYYWIRTIAGEWDADISADAGPVAGRRAVPPPTVPTVNLREGLAAYYPFDGNADDASGNERHLAYQYGSVPESALDRSGKSGAAFAVSGDTRLASATNQALAAVLAGDFTFAAWVRTDRTETLRNEQLRGFNTGCNFLVHPTPGADGSSGLGLSVGVNGINLFECNGSSLPCVLRYAAELGAGWHHVAFTVSEGGSPALYVDGQYAKTGIRTDAVRSLPVGIGVFGGNYGGFTGAADDVCYYDRALDASEIAALFEAGTPLAPDRPIVATPTVAVDEGDGSASVSVTCEDGDATVYYSIWRTDGGDTVDSREYTVPFTVEGNATVIVWAVRDGYYNSPRVKVQVRAGWTADVRRGLSDDPLIAWSTSGDTDWFLDPSVSSDGGDGSMRSGRIGGNAASSLTATFSGAGTFAFDWKVSSEYGFDFLTVTVDGETPHRISGEVDWTELVLEFTNDATHTVSWTYAKDATTDRGADCGWVDYVQWVPLGSAAMPPVATVTPVGEGETNIVALASGTPGAMIEYALAAYGERLMSDAVWMPYEEPFGVIGDKTLYARAKKTGLVDSLPSRSDIRRPWIVRIRQALVGDETTRAAVGFTPDWYGYSVDEAYWWDDDAETVSDGGFSSIRSPAIGDAEAASVFATFSGPGTLFFDRKVDSEAGWDVLTYYAGEYEQDYSYCDAVSGNRDWERIKIVFTSAHLHVIEWEYDKDASGRTGTDAGWVDNLVWMPARYVPAEPEARTGYTFGGYTAAGRTYEAGAMLDAEDEATDFEPVWTANRYTVSYQAEAASEDIETVQKWTYDVDCVLLTADDIVIARGYAFNGWTLANGPGQPLFAGGATIRNLAAEEGAEVVLKPVLTPIGYTIRLYDGVSVDPQVIAATYDTEVTLPAPAPREGYTFDGWAFAPSGTVAHVAGDAVKNLVIYDGQSVAFYALWTLVVPDDPIKDAIGIDDPDVVVMTGGDEGWFAQGDVKVEGDAALQSGKIRANQSSILETYLFYPVRKRISFWWKVSSEKDWDTFAFFINDVEKARISGLDGDWMEYTAILDAGTNHVKWVYSKDDTGDRGEDCGWLDKFTVSDITDAEAQEIEEREREEEEKREEDVREEALFKVIQYTISKRPYTVDDALAATNTPSIWMEPPVTGTYPQINFGDNVTVTTHFPSSRVSFPGNAQGGRKATYYACQVTGRINVPEAGKWTFACGSDDGFRCILSNADGWTDSFEYYKDRSYGTTLKTFNFPKAGTYDLYLIYFEYGDNSILDLSCAKGTYSSFSILNASKFKLVGTPESRVTLVGKGK